MKIPLTAERSTEQKNAPALTSGRDAAPAFMKGGAGGGGGGGGGPGGAGMASGELDGSDTGGNTGGEDAEPAENSKRWSTAKEI